MQNLLWLERHRINRTVTDGFQVILRIPHIFLEFHQYFSSFNLILPLGGWGGSWDPQHLASSIKLRLHLCLGPLRFRLWGAGAGGIGASPCALGSHLHCKAAPAGCWDLASGCPLCRADTPGRVESECSGNSLLWMECWCAPKIHVLKS